ncbi:hypothetical protein [Mycolicibacterium neworleansense]|uniref:Polyketide cyclase / dehydrase and lipid transport n=1 Tax=Mycolicibacterium neworleansense TaxID=146018 RepID=A0A0H5RZ23_9MYCO|nr:hypothetical protein [Mycolicibacterium neworleansense]MCV7364195.1 hypothetical protein [Mycolicibacterium neworleansense]CRZ19111.1 hypothetical protein BN2156_06026 [Mycolicibacterium neworleansense]
MQRIHVETILPTDTERVWQAMQQVPTFLYVCRGLFGVPALAGRTEPFQAGDRGTGWLFAFHVIPAYRHTIEVLDVDGATRTIRTHEYGGVLRSWDHTLHVEPVTDRSCRYSDTVEIDAGRLTSVVVALARGIYAYRHRRWRRLVDKHMSEAGLGAGGGRGQVDAAEHHLDD